MTSLSFNKESTPLVSIIVTTFNRSTLLEETLGSILGQTFDDFELIVVDNMSTDNTSDIISVIGDSRIRYFKNENNGVIAVNRNFGIKHAKGRYVAFCDDDDLWFPNKLHLQVGLMELNPLYALCYTNAIAFYGNKITSMKMMRRTVSEEHFSHLLSGNFIPSSSVLIKRDIFSSIGFLSENPLIREDYDMWLRVAYFYPIVGIDSSLIFYRVHSNNSAGNKANETLRAIRTFKGIVDLLGVPKYLVIPNLILHFIKYLAYKIKNSIFF